MGVLSFKIKPIKSIKKKKESNALTKLSKLVKGVCRLDEDGNYKVQIKYNESENPDWLYLDFTENSYNLKGRTSIFTKTKDKKGKYTRIIRDKLTAIAFPGDSEKYIPFSPNWIIEGYICRIDGKLVFDFHNIVTIEGYSVYIAEIDNGNNTGE